jgi:ABC-2 type transport system ATP-binding protein
MLEACSNKEVLLVAIGTIEVHNLQKTFKGNVQALKGVSFSIAKGEFFSFLGPNGAGKSTAIQILTTLISPTGGQALVSGFDVMTQAEKVRLEIGVALQETGIDPALTGRELLEIQARHFGLSVVAAKKRAVELLEKINLTEDADRRCGKYSGGMRRRLDLALSLVHRPNILFLDEPTTGLDPVNRIAIWEEIRDLNRQLGTTIFLTTQYLEEADQLAERVSIIDKGQIVISGTPKELKRHIGMDVIELHFADRAVAEKAVQLLNPLVKQSTHADQVVKLFVEDGAHRLPELVRQLDSASLHIASLNLSPPTLDDVFIQVTGRGDGVKKEAETV